MLAGLLAAVAAYGMHAVVNQIEQAVGVAARVASFSDIAAAKARLMALDHQTFEDTVARRLADSREGGQLAQQAAVALCDTLERTFTDLESALKTFKFHIEHKKPTIFIVLAPYRLALHVAYWN